MRNVSSCSTCLRCRYIGFAFSFESKIFRTASSILSTSGLIANCGCDHSSRAGFHVRNGGCPIVTKHAGSRSRGNLLFEKDANGPLGQLGFKSEVCNVGVDLRKDARRFYLPLRE